MVKNLPNEDIVNSIDSNRLILTNKRLMYYDNVNYQSIRVKDVRFISYGVKRFPKIIYYTFIICSLLLLFIGLDNSTKGYSNNDDLIFVLVVFIAGLFVYLFYTRKILKVGTAGGFINVNLQGIGRRYVEEFIGQIENEIDKHKY